jgi:hypothetical protein
MSRERLARGTAMRKLVIGFKVASLAVFFAAAMR